MKIFSQCRVRNAKDVILRAFSFTFLRAKRGGPARGREEESFLRSQDYIIARE